MDYDYMNKELSIDERTEALLSQMTIEEKIAQTKGIDPVSLLLSDEEKEIMLKTNEIPNQKLKDMLKYGIGSFQLPGRNMDPAESGIYRNVLQKYVKEHTRLGIPVLSQEECLNGQLAKGATMFPRPIGMAGSFDVETVNEVYSAIGRETRARGGHQAFTPVLDLGRDPRWGRIEETFGEDTCLVTEMGKAAVSGLQGSCNGVTEDHIISSPKHFAGYGQCDGGRNFAPTQLTERVLWDQVFPPFEAAVKECKALGIMPSHAEIDGIPCHGNKWLLTQVLKEKWGFEGIVVSDYNDVLRLDILHHVARNQTEAAAAGIEAGVDMDVPQGSAYCSLDEAIKQKPELMEKLDNAVRRILKLKFKLGLFDNPYVDVEKINNIVHSPEHVRLAKKAADKVLTLLKNDNNILPLNMDNCKKIAVIGPNADPVQFSYYSSIPNIGVSILDGIKEIVKDKCEVLYEMGCHITKKAEVMEVELDVEAKNPVEYTYEEEKEMIDRAVEAAKKADAVILCLGGSPSSSREAVTLEKHYGDNASLDLPGQQNKLAEKIMECCKKVVCVLINGKPLSCGYVYDNVPAVLEGWYLGIETGHAVADAIFGRTNPGGKLPVTIVRNSGHLPGYYSQKATGFLKGYLFEKNEPYFWFGYGLSYTTFLYKQLNISSKTFSKDETLNVGIEIVNTGDRDGEEIVQLYISDLQASITRPERALKAFKRVFIKAHDTVYVDFDVTAKMLEFTGTDMIKRAEPGDFIIRVGRNCRDTVNAVVKLV